MPEKPIFGQLRDLDQAVEREIAKYLDQHLYNAPTFESIERISDENAQKRGKDIVVSSVALKLDKVIIDEKSASHYVNITNLHTFVFELTFYRKDGNQQYTILTDGWLTSPSMVTDYYLLVWPFAKEDQIIKYRFKGKDYPYFKCEDITSLDYALVSRAKIKEYLKEQGFDDKWLGITMMTIRKHAAVQDNPYFKERFRNLVFSCSNQLNERPVNVLIEKDVLFDLALICGTC